MKDELWAWYDAENDQYRMIYPSRFQVKMCSPDFFRRATKAREGKIVKLKVIEVEDKED